MRGKTATQGHRLINRTSLSAAPKLAVIHSQPHLTLTRQAPAGRPAYKEEDVSVNDWIKYHKQMLVNETKNSETRRIGYN